MALTKIDDRGLKTPIDLLDNEKIRFGTGNDLQIYHDGTGSYIDNNTGELQISNANSTLFLQPKQGENSLKLIPDGAVELYYDGVKRFETNSAGVKVTGQIEADELYIRDDEKILLGTGSDLQIYHNGTSSFIDNNNGSVYIRNNVDNWNADHIFIEAKSGDSSIKCLGEADVELYYDGSKKIYTQSNGARVEGRLWVTDYIDLQGNLFLQDNKKVVLGNGSDLEIYHDPQYGHSWIKESGGGILGISTSTLEVYNAAVSEKLITAYQDGAVEIYWDGSKKMESTSSGITVTGTVTETSDISLKNNINTIQNPLDLIEQIRGINFTWKTNGMKSMGVIAQDVEKVFPELVHGSEGSKSLQYSGLIGALVESVKELSAKVNALEAK